MPRGIYKRKKSTRGPAARYLVEKALTPHGQEMETAIMATSERTYGQRAMLSPVGVRLKLPLRKRVTIEALIDEAYHEGGRNGWTEEVKRQLHGEISNLKRQLWKAQRDGNRFRLLADLLIKDLPAEA